MIIADKFIIGHIPKTGGHAIAFMLNKIPNLKIESSFSYDNTRALHTEEGANLHSSFDELKYEEIENKDLILVIRELPSWFYSILWHQGIHSLLNRKDGISKYKIREVYSDYFKALKPQSIILPEIASQTLYPDFKLKQIAGKYLYEDKIIWFRMEYLANDLIEYLKTKDIILSKACMNEIKESCNYHTYKTKLPSNRYWNLASKDILYINNPLWKSIENRIY